MNPLTDCPRCGEPNGKQRCPKCHASAAAHEETVGPVAFARARAFNELLGQPAPTPEEE